MLSQKLKPLLKVSLSQKTKIKKIVADAFSSTSGKIFSKKCQAIWQSKSYFQKWPSDWGTPKDFFETPKNY